MQKIEILIHKLKDLNQLQQEVNDIIADDFKEFTKDPKVKKLLDDFLDHKFSTNAIVEKHWMNVERYPECEKCVKNIDVMIRICEKCVDADRFIERVKI